MLDLFSLRDDEKNAFWREPVVLISQLITQILLIGFSYACSPLFGELMSTASEEHDDNPAQNKWLKCRISLFFTASFES